MAAARSASAPIGKLDLTRATIVEHDNRADVTTAQEHGSPLSKCTVRVSSSKATVACIAGRSLMA